MLRHGAGLVADRPYLRWADDNSGCFGPLHALSARQSSEEK